MSIPANLSIVIPAYNEAERLPASLALVRSFMDRRARGYEVVVVNDGSRDSTEAKVEELAETWPELRLLNNPGNRGKGFSVRNGVLNARGDAILFTDADLSTPIDDLEKLAAFLDAFPVVIGSRGLKDADIQIHQPAHRELLGRAFNLAFQAMLLPGVHDSQCGFKLFTRQAARACFSRATIDGFGFDGEVLFLARKLGFGIKEVPVVWRNDLRSKVSPLKDGTRMLADLVTTRLRHRSL